jgi:NTE family protein
MRSHEHKIYTPPKRGLVLSGGGARGAYQVGCFKAFKELGLDFPIVAGTSVGALNGALYCLDDLARTEQIWTSIATGDVLDVPGLITGLVPLVAPGASSATASAPARKRKPWHAVLDITRTVLSAWRGFNRANKEKLACLLDLYLDPVALKRARRELIVTITTLRGTHYESTRDLSSRAIREHILASASIPFVFDPVFSTSRLRLAWDGGANLFNPGALTPIEPLYERGVRDMVVVWLLPQFKVLSHLYPGARLTHIAPKKSLGNFLRFSPDRARKLMEMGYEDAMKALR